MPAGTQQVIEGLLCALCDELLEEDLNNEGICNGCSDELMQSCEQCSYEALDADNMNMNGYIRARQAGLVFSTFHYTQDTGVCLCDECTVFCDNCGSTFEYEDNMYECCGCSSSSVFNYSYRPQFLYYNGNLCTGAEIPGVLYMGAEIEVNKMSHLADRFYDRLTSTDKDFMYMKEDGSLGPTGVEIVTMPATLDAFDERFPFDALDWARAEGARSFAYESCGFHIHVARSAFTATHMWRFVKFQLKNPALCQRVAQRQESAYATWYYEDSERNDIPEYVKGKRSNGRRYLAINFQNRATVELRYFKGNILKAAIMKNMEFVQSMYDYTKTMTVRQVMAGNLSESSYLQWLETNAEKYPYLTYFLANNANKESN